MTHLLNAVLFFFFSTFAFGQINLYVSPTGSDSNNGTAIAPFESIQQAKLKARDFLATNQNIFINILPGTYELEETLKFDSSDSPDDGYYVTYQKWDINKGEVLISGGSKVTNWTLHDPVKNIWKANVGATYSRQLYKGNTKLKRARSQDSMGLFETKTGYFSSCTDFSTWENIQDLEIISNVEWRSYRLLVKEHCASCKELVFDSCQWSLIHHQPNFKRAPVAWIENAYELIDEEGEWYIEKNGSSDNFLYLKSTNPPIDIIIPRLEQLITMIEESDKPIKNIKFIGLRFSYSSWHMKIKGTPSNEEKYGFMPRQADALMYYNDEYECDGSGEGGITTDYQIPGAISLKFAHEIHFINNTFSNLGSTGLELFEGSSHNIICNNIFSDISGSGISIGAYKQATNENFNNPNFSDLLKIPDENEVTNNLIENIANDYLSSVGIFVSFARNTTIKNNEIKNFPYTGISVGWGWNNLISYVGVNEISYNKIDCSSQIIQDGGAIYTLSNQADFVNTSLRTEIHDNYIFNHKTYMGAIYLDKGSSNINVYNNIIDANLPNLDVCKESVGWIYLQYCGLINLNIENNYHKNIYPAYTDTDFPFTCQVNPCDSKTIETVVNGDTIITVVPLSEVNCKTFDINNNSSFSTLSGNALTIKNNAGRQSNPICQ